MDKSEHPTMGQFKGREHHYPVRVFYEDTDFTGIVYYANYLRFFERGRSSFLRLIGVEHAKLWDSDDPFAFAIRKMHTDYMKPAHIDDHLNIVTTYDSLKGARLIISQACYRGDELLVKAYVEAAVISRSGRPRRASGWMSELIAPYLEAH